MKKTQKIVGLNLLILLVYNVLVFSIAYLYLAQEGYDLANYTFVMVLCILLQCVICIGLSISHFVRKNAQLGKTYLLSFLVVLIIGFSSCLGGMSALDKVFF